MELGQSVWAGIKIYRMQEEKLILNNQFRRTIFSVAIEREGSH